jgi:HEAT repeat protein
MRKDVKDALGVATDTEHELTAIRRTVMSFFKPPNIERLKARGDIKRLVKALGHKDQARRKAAYQALLEIGTPAVNLLLVALTRKNKTARLESAALLGDIGDARAWDSLVAALDDEYWRVRYNAIYGLKRINAERAIEPLITALKDPNKEVTENACAGLVAMGAPAVEQLITALKDDHPWIRQYAAIALGRIGDGRAWQPLVIALEDQNIFVREYAVCALPKIDSERAILPAITALGDSAGEVSQAAAETLIEIGAPALKSLIAATHNVDSRIRASVVGALGKIGNAQAMDALVHCLEDGEAFVRIRAAQALDEMGWTADSDEVKARYLAVCQEHQVLSDFIQKLSLKPRGLEMVHPEKMKAITAIEELGQTAVIPLLEALNRMGTDAYTSIISLLGQLKDERAIRPIAKKLESPLPNVQYEAAVALRNYSAHEIQRAQIKWYLEKAASDPNIDVRNAVAQVLNKLGCTVQEVPWFTGTNTWQELVTAFIRLESEKPSPDYRELAQRLEKFSAPERHGAWIHVAEKLENKTDTIRCYLEALHNDPDPSSIAWDWLSGQYDEEMGVLPPDSPRTRRAVEKLRREYGPIS